MEDIYRQKLCTFYESATREVFGVRKNISLSSQVKIERSVYINQFPLKAFFMSKVANLSVTSFACYFYFYKLSIPTRDIRGFFFMLYTEMNIPNQLVLKSYFFEASAFCHTIQMIRATRSLEYQQNGHQGLLLKILRDTVKSAKPNGK